MLPWCRRCLHMICWTKCLLQMLFGMRNCCMNSTHTMICCSNLLKEESS
uniref:Uncharacterized protein n=1 Tax=Arundo donax TaxID=35708 RepID=A0A0A9BER8_ARUDO